MSKRLRFGAIFVGVALALALGQGPVLAQGDPSGRQVVADESSEAQDRTAVEAALAAFSAGGFPALKDHLAALAAVLDHAPTAYPRTVESDDQVLIRAHDREEFVGLANMTRARWAKSGEQQRKIVGVLNTYGEASFLLGSYYNETSQPEEALRVLQRGRTLDRSDPLIATEMGVALLQQKQLQEALRLYDEALADNSLVLGRDRARLLRARGFALTDLGRLDEAEQAYRDSLVVEPSHKGAQMELDYIARLRKGGPTAPEVFPTVDKARQGQSPDPK